MFVGRGGGDTLMQTNKCNICDGWLDTVGEKSVSSWTVEIWASVLCYKYGVGNAAGKDFCLLGILVG